MTEEKVEGFYPIEILIAKKPEIIKRIMFPKNRTDNRVSNIINLAKNAGTSVEQLERFYLKKLQLNDELVENLQIF